MKKSGKQIILTGIRPTGIMHLGNYAGMILPLVKLQNISSGEKKIFLMVADLHALTTIEDEKNLGKNIILTVSLALASGVNPKKMTLFVQSRVPEHSELSVVLGMIVPISV